MYRAGRLSKAYAHLDSWGSKGSWGRMHRGSPCRQRPVTAWPEPQSKETASTRQRGSIFSDFLERCTSLPPPCAREPAMAASSAPFPVASTGVEPAHLRSVGTYMRSEGGCWAILIPVRHLQLQPSSWVQMHAIMIRDWPVDAMVQNRHAARFVRSDMHLVLLSSNRNTT